MEVPQTLDANVILKIDLNDTSANQSMSQSPVARAQESIAQETIAQSYVDQSMIPKGHSILAKGGGMSNAAVQYTNSRSFKNVYKGRGSLEPSKLLQGMALGRGMSKGQSILNSGGGLSGMSLFKMEHYNPLETIDDAIGGEEEKHGGDETKKDSKGKTNDDNDDDDDTDDDDSFSSISSVDTDEEKGTNPATPTASKGLGSSSQLTPEARRKQIEEILKAAYKSDNDDDENAESGKVDHEGDSDDYADTQNPSGDLQGLNILQRLATDANGRQLTDNKGRVYWGKYLHINNVKRTYLIQEKKENEWQLVTNGLFKPFHNYPRVSKLTSHNDNTIFNNIGDSVIIGKFRITLWSKSMLFSREKYLDKSNQ
jgi:hypothetical protein